jgi:hypothetical protein
LSGFGHLSGFSNPVEDARRSDEANLHTEESDKDTRSRTVTQMGRATAIGIRAAAPRRHIMNSLAHAGSGEFDGEQRTRAQKRASHATSHAPVARRGVSRRHRHRILKDSPWRCKQDTGRAHTHRRREPNQTTERRPSGDRAATERRPSGSTAGQSGTEDRVGARACDDAHASARERTSAICSVGIRREWCRSRLIVKQRLIRSWVAWVASNLHEARCELSEMEFAEETSRQSSPKWNSAKKRHAMRRPHLATFWKNQRAIQRAFIAGDAEVVSTQRKYPVVHPPRRRSARLHIRAANLQYYLWA